MSCLDEIYQMKLSRIILSVFFVLLMNSVPVFSADDSLSSFASLVHTESWSETWLDEEGKSQSRSVTEEIWTEAFQAALKNNKIVYIPARKKPYYLDGPIILQSGDSIKADPSAEIRLKPNTNTCMVRNKNIVSFAERKIPKDQPMDTDITIEGGIWTTLATGDKKANGNIRGYSSKKNYIPGTNGVILLQNVKRVRILNVTIKESKPFGIHLSHAEQFVVDGVSLDHHRRDGVHVNGPSSEGLIRNVKGNSHDDTVALNAWDWRNSAPCFGAIHHITIEHVSGSIPGKRSADSIRLLPGVKLFKDGKTVDCSIYEIIIRDIKDIREFKFYDQPNLEQGRDNDFSYKLGKLKNIHLKGLKLTRPGVIQIAADVDGMYVEDVDLQFSPADNFKLVEIGPMSMTWRPSTDSSKWVEIFSPDRDVTVRNFHLGKIRINNQLVPDAESRFLQVKDQQINTDYPNTFPRGGTGKATLLK